MMLHIFQQSANELIDKTTINYLEKSRAFVEWFTIDLAFLRHRLEILQRVQKSHNEVWKSYDKF